MEGEKGREEEEEEEEEEDLGECPRVVWVLFYLME